MICQKLGQLSDCVFAASGAWHPFPKAADRKAWLALPPATRETCVADGVRYLDWNWPMLSATEILAYTRDGNRTRYQKPYFERRQALTSLVLAECCEGQGRFLDQIVNGIWCICEETSWCVPAHIRGEAGSGGLPDPRRPVVDLFAAETGAILACVLYLLEDELGRISNLLPLQVRSAIEMRILDPALARDDFWWMGLEPPARKLNNWTPWIVSNWLLCALLADDDPGRRVSGVYKAAGCLDRYLALMPADGGCDEGPGYWGRAAASLFDALETLMSATDGALSFYDDPLIRALGRYIVNLHIAGDWYVAFADASACANPPAHVVYGFGVRTADTDLMRLGASHWQRKQAVKAAAGFGHDLNRALQALFRFPITTAVETPAPFIRQAWLPDTEVVTARDREGCAQGWFLAAKGGHNNESHNHNDVGSFIVFRDGAPLLVDAGVGEYTRQTFGPERYSIWTMRSEYHNLLPVFDGVGQMPGVSFRARQTACRMSDSEVGFSLELQDAYPPEAKLEAWSRDIVLVRGVGVTITDHYRLAADVAEMTLMLLTPSRPERVGDNSVRLTAQMLPDAIASAEGRIEIEAEHAEIVVGELPLDDARLASVWGRRLYTVKLLLRQPSPTGRLRLAITGSDPQ